MNPEEKAVLEARRRRLVGAVLSTGSPSESVEATFRGRFGRFFGQPQFWDAFEKACLTAKGKESWATARQLMLSYSLPQEVNAQDEWDTNKGETMLTLAATYGRAAVVNILCQIKGKPAIENAKGWSAVHIAAAYNHVAVLEVLLTLGVSVDEPGSRLGFTPLHLAASVDNVEVLECLYKAKKADFMKRAGNGYSVLHVAAENGSSKCVAFLTRHMPDLQHVYDTVLRENPAHKAAKCLQPHVYHQLAASGTRINLENVEDDTAWDLQSYNERYAY